MTVGAPGEFTGFTPALLTFLRSLARHNNRTWFEANRPRYERDVRAPLAALVEEMDVHLATIAPEIVGTPRRSLFRIHRDVRFSSDKRPYKTQAACWFYHGDAGHGVGSATAAHGGAGFYFHVEPGRILVGGGIWRPPRPTLARIRERIAEEYPRVRRLLAEPAVRRAYGALSPEAMLVRMPRGYPAEHPAADLLRHQSFTLGRELTELELFSPRLASNLARDFTRLVPMVRWFNGALGLRPLARR